MKHCKRCGIPVIVGNTCSDCKSIIYQEKIEKRVNRQLAKVKGTVEYGMSRVKRVAQVKFWASSHRNCFRCSFGKSESKEHRDKKYERWVYHRELGRTVFCELRLKKNMGRPDLIIIDKGFVWIEEIVKSEREASLILKKNKYPFKIKIVRCNDANKSKK